MLRTKFITAAEVKLINARIIGPARSSAHNDALLTKVIPLPIRQEALMNDKSIDQLAATLASNLIKHPIFPAGNKRTALLATALFRLRNGSKPLSVASKAIGNDAMVEVHRRLETGEVDETEYAGVCSRLWRLPKRPFPEVKIGRVGRLESGNSSSALNLTYERTALTALFDGNRLVYPDHILIDYGCTGSVVLQRAVLGLGLFEPLRNGGRVSLEGALEPEYPNGSDYECPNQDYWKSSGYKWSGDLDNPWLHQYSCSNLDDIWPDQYLVIPTSKAPWAEGKASWSVVRAWEEEFFDYAAMEVEPYCVWIKHPSRQRPSFKMDPERRAPFKRLWEDISSIGTIFNRALRDFGSND